MRATLCLVCCAVVLMGSCAPHGSSELPVGVECIDCDGHTHNSGVGKVDVLWVIDNSASMCEEQADLRNNLDAFVEQLVSVGADFQLAVITTDLEEASQPGRFQNVPNTAPDDDQTCQVDISQCPSPENRQEYPPLIIKSTDPRYLDADDQPDVAKIQRDFGCSATVGTTGTEFETGLETARRALSPALTSGFNAGFLRDDAFLAVIFVSDENDCSNDDTIDLTSEDDDICEWDRDSLTPVQEYVDFFSSLKTDVNGDPDPSQIIMAAIIGPSNRVNTNRPDPVEPTCTADTGDGFAGYRYKALLDAFENSYEDDICAPPFNSALEAIGALITDVISERCLQAAPATCESDADCDGACVARGEYMLCDTFRIEVTIERPISEGLPVGFALIEGEDSSPGQCAELTTNGQYQCILVEGEHYEIDYAATCKPTGIEINLLQPLSSTDQLTLNYPRSTAIASP